jgi:hypothetical protein
MRYISVGTGSIALLKVYPVASRYEQQINDDHNDFLHISSKKYSGLGVADSNLLVQEITASTILT